MQFIYTLLGPDDISACLTPENVRCTGSNPRTGATAGVRRTVQGSPVLLTCETSQVQSHLPVIEQASPSPKATSIPTWRDTL